MTIRGNFELFQYFNLETGFLENENLFQKLEYRLLVESTKIENTSFPYKTAMSEAHVKTNRMVSTKWTYHKERSFASNCCVFFENFVSVSEPLIKSLFEVKNDPNEQRLNISLKFT